MVFDDMLTGVWDLITTSELQFNNIDYQEAAKYVAVMCDQSVIKRHNLVSVIPVRQTVLDGTSRKSPTLAFLDSDTYTRTSKGKIEKDVQKWNWTGKKKPSSLQKKRLLALALMEVIRTTLGNHIYQFNGGLDTPGTPGKLWQQEPWQRWTMMSTISTS